MMKRLAFLSIKALFVCDFFGLQTLVHDQESRNLTLLVLAFVNPGKSR